MGKKFWSFRNVAESDDRELCIDGVIAEESWFDDDVTPKLFKDELNAGKGNITLWINSPGGDCIAASQIYTMLIEYAGNVTIKIDGIAASAASVIAMAGTNVLMSPTSMLMIHNPQTIAAGDHNDMSKAIDVLNEVKESIINAYQLKTGKSRAKISQMMEDETWMNANAAIRDGFADGIIGASEGIEEEDDKDTDSDSKEPEKPNDEPQEPSESEDDGDKKETEPKNCVTFSQRQSNLKLVAKMADKSQPLPIKATNSTREDKPHTKSDTEPKNEYSIVDVYRARLDVYKKSLNH